MSLQEFLLLDEGFGLGLDLLLLLIIPLDFLVIFLDLGGQVLLYLGIGAAQRLAIRTSRFST